MRFFEFLLIYIIVLPIVISAFDISTFSKSDVNLTNWRLHHRKKRFLVYHNASISKMAISYGFPIEFEDKKPWRQLSISINLHYNYPVILKPMFWWERWNTRKMPDGAAILRAPEYLQKYKDEAQEFLYRFAENIMERWNMNGRACVQRSICENAQIHMNQGLHAQILHRILRPQRNLDPAYTEAWHIGKKGYDCRAVYPEAKKCLLDDYVHVWEDFNQQTFVKARGGV